MTRTDALSHAYFGQQWKIRLATCTVHHSWSYLGGGFQIEVGSLNIKGADASANDSMTFFPRWQPNAGHGNILKQGSRVSFFFLFLLEAKKGKYRVPCV